MSETHNALQVSVRFQQAAISSAASLDNLETHMESGCMIRALSTSADVHATADLFNTMQADAWEPIALVRIPQCLNSLVVNFTLVRLHFHMLSPVHIHI